MPKPYLVMSDIAVFRMCTLPLPLFSSIFIMNKCTHFNGLHTTKKLKE